jgi:hypothetical protein
MAANQSANDWRELRSALDALKWGDGLTRSEMFNQSPALRRPEIGHLPPRFRFPNASSVISYFEQLEQSDTIDVAAYPPPSGYSDTSTTGLTFAGRPLNPGVGSGYRNANTGSSAQTGVGREGTGTRSKWDT